MGLHGRCAAVLVVALAAGAGGCEITPMAVPVVNQPPQVTITEAPIRDSTTVTLVTLRWSAADPDGRVAFFRYALDDTTGTDAWQRTTAYELTLAVTAPEAGGVDTVLAGAQAQPRERFWFRGAHSFFLEAVDDRGARSARVSISFDSHTIAPETRIESPGPRGIVMSGPRLEVRWSGEDLDGPGPPVGYSWRLVEVDNVISMSDAEIAATLFDPAANGAPWSPFAPRTSVVLRGLRLPGSYLFGLRALDAAGAIEPCLRTFRAPGPANVLLLRVEEEGGRPRLRVDGITHSVEFPAGAAATRVFQIPANTGVRFTWEGDAGSYGGVIAGYAYGVDLDDLSPANPGWSAESAGLTEARLRFALAPGAPVEEHLLFIRVRDTFGGTLIAELELLVIPFSFERAVLYVDDWGRDDRGRAYPEIGPECTAASQGGEIPDAKVVPLGGQPQDHCHDAYLRDAIAAALAAAGPPGGVADRYEPLDPVTGRVLTGRTEIDSVSHAYRVIRGRLTLGQLARYQLVIWSGGSSPGSLLYTLNRGRGENLLASYIEAGGHVWLTGMHVFRNSSSGCWWPPEPDPCGCVCFRPGDFGYRYLHVRSTLADRCTCTAGRFCEGGGGWHRWRDGLAGAYTSRTAGSEGFPALRVTRPPYGDGLTRGIPHCEAMVKPFGLDIQAVLGAAGGRLDSLYFYESAARRAGGESWMDDGVTALRYAGPGQGKLMMCGFPLFYFPQEQLAALLEAGLRWFDLQ